MITINNYLLLLLSFFITTSIFISDVIIFLLFFSWLISGNYKNKLQLIFSNPITLPAILFFIYFLLSHFWAADSVFNSTTKKQLLILLLPILCTLDFQDKYVEKAKYGFIIGLFFNIILSLFTFINPTNALFKTGHYESAIFAHGFLDHFDYSIFLCFGILLIFSFLTKKRQSLFYYICIIAFLIALLNSYGRIGILCFFIFIPLSILVFQKSKVNYILLVVGLAFGTLSYYVFPPFNERINETIENIYLLYQPKSLMEKIEDDAEYLANQDTLFNKEYFIEEITQSEEKINLIDKKTPEYDTSIGKRYIYAKNSITLIKNKLFFGFGANQFSLIYNSHFQSKNGGEVKQPHNNFIFIVFELGLVGLFLMLLIFFFQMKIYFTSKKKNWLRFVFPLFFLFIMFFDNYFLNHNTLVFFCIFTFILYYPVHTKFKPDKLS